jgi:protein SCO1/2
MNAKTLFGGVVSGLLLSLLLVGALVRQGPPKSAPAEVLAARPQTLEKLWPAPSFAYRSERGVMVTNGSLAGRPWVANFIFTQCRTICPLLTTKMVQLQRQLPNVDLRFVSFSVDPGHDTPEVLDAYRRQWSADEPRWVLLATDAQTLPRTAAGFHVTAEPAPEGQVDRVIHSGVFVLVDEEGIVRGIYDTEHRETFAALARDARTLAKAQAMAIPAPRAPRTGAELYHELSCIVCHENPALAPLLGGIAGRRRELNTGALVVADADYVRRAILWPDADLVRGYPLRMPTYEGLLDETSLTLLIDWVLTRPGPLSIDAGEGTAELAEDPVCHMAVRVAGDTPRAAVDGGFRYFCAEMCRDAYLAAPTAYERP